LLHVLVRRPAALLAIAALAAGIAVAPARAADPYEMYAILSLTGPFAFLGNSEATALRTAESVVNANGGIHGQPIHINIMDDSSQPQVAVQLANTIIAKRVPVMFGPTYVASCLAVAPLVRAAGPVQYCFAPTIHPAAGSYTFSASAASGDQAIETLVFAQAKGWKRLGLIATTDATGQDIENTFTQALATGKFPGITIVDREHFASGDVSIAAQIAKIKASDPDAILSTTVGTATGTVFHALKDEGIDVPVITNLGNLQHAQLDGLTSVIPNQMYFTAPRFVARDVSGQGPVRDAQLQFYKAFNAQGIDPDVGNNLAWDVAFVVFDSLRHVGLNATPKELLDYMEGLHGFAMTDGIYDYRGGDQRGVGLNSLVMARWNPAKRTWVTVSAPGGKPLANQRDGEPKSGK
jgi:branched-chain amino acid transport system substrate-binding protein